MSYQAAYHPEILVEESLTKFGALETNHPILYDKPLSGKYIVKIDTLEPLKELWGDTILMSRDLTYKIVSGKYNNEDEYRKLLSSYYKRYDKFREYINTAYIFKDKQIPLHLRIVGPAREAINDYYKEVSEQMQNLGGKMLMRTHDYVYYCFKYDVCSKLTGEVEIIC